MTAVCGAGSISAIDSRPWQTHYDSGVRPTLGEYPERTLIDYLKDSARERPDHPALLFAGNRISYAALDRLSDTFGAALVSIGVKPGDRVALMLPNAPQFVIAQLGAWKAGAIVVALNPIYTE
ncbi:MAG TPA: AMP-binding protein, partial [Vicinamibacterales bacterium]